MTPAQFAVLLALAAGEQHGYGLIRQVEDLTDGHVTLGPGTLYRTLQRLSVEQLIEETGTDPEAVRADRRAQRQRRYRLTTVGREIIRAEVQRLAKLLRCEPAQVLLREEGVSVTATDAHEETKARS